MNLYTALRKQAAKRRDARIQAARHAFHDHLKQIAQLERELEGTVSRPYKLRTMVDLFKEAMPHDRLFTVNGMIELISNAQPGRIIHGPTVREIFSRFEREGSLRRVGRASGNVQWAAADYKAPESPYGASPLTDVAEEVLRDRGALKPTELLAAIRVRGYRSEDDPRVLLSTLGTSLKRSPTFRKQDGKWALRFG